jgi:hypothetical protein
MAERESEDNGITWRKAASRRREEREIDFDGLFSHSFSTTIVIQILGKKRTN